MEKAIEKMAKEENKTKSQLIRDAFRAYADDKDWARIRKWGDEIAKRMGIETYDDVEKIAG